MTAPDLSREIRAWLAEDVGAGDLTTNATVPDDATCRAGMLLKEPGVVCGLELVRQVYAGAGPPGERRGGRCGW